MVAFAPQDNPLNGVMVEGQPNYDLPLLAGLAYEPYKEEEIPFITPEEEDEPNLHQSVHDPVRTEEIEAWRDKHEYD